MRSRNGRGCGHCGEHVLIRGSVPGPLPFFRFIKRAVEEKEEVCDVAGVELRIVDAFGRIAAVIGYFEVLRDRKAVLKVDEFIVGCTTALLRGVRVTIGIRKSRAQRQDHVHQSLS